jgi:hypothetical protein
LPWDKALYQPISSIKQGDDAPAADANGQGRRQNLGENQFHTYVQDAESTQGCFQAIYK